MNFAFYCFVSFSGCKIGRNSLHFQSFLWFKQMIYPLPSSVSQSVSSVAQSCPTLCDPMNPSTPGLPVHHQIPEFTQTHVHRVWCHPAISYSVVPLSSYPQSLPTSGSFPMSQLFTWGDQSIGVPASASVLPMNTQDWSPLEWTWVSLQSKGFSRVFSNTTVQKHQFLAFSFIHSPTLTSIHDYWKNHRLD